MWSINVYVFVVVVDDDVVYVVVVFNDVVVALLVVADPLDLVVVSKCSSGQKASGWLLIAEIWVKQSWVYRCSNFYKWFRKLL